MTARCGDELGDNSVLPDVLQFRTIPGPDGDLGYLRIRTFRVATWLGWQIESNWADPALFALYLIVKPITGSMVLVCMFFAARTVVQTPPEFLP